MSGENSLLLTYKVFYVSYEETNCPLVLEIVKFGKKLLGFDIIEKNSAMTVSMKYGKRMLLNSNVADFSNIQKKELLEIVDYDPLKNILLIIGPEEPKVETTLHWMIHHARYEVNVVVQINRKDYAEKLMDKYPVTDEKLTMGSLDMSKNVLKNLKDSNIVVLREQGVLFTGDKPENVERNILETIGAVK